MTRRDPVATRRALVDSAVELFGRDGFDVTSVQRIADHAGLTKGSFYHHFGSKQAVLHEIHERFIDDNLARLREVLASGAPADEQLRGIIRDVIVDGAGRFRAEITIFYQEHRRLDPEEFAELWAKRKKFEQGVIDIVRRGIEAGTFKDAGDPKLIAFGVVGMAAWTHHWLEPGRGNVHEIGDLYADIVLRGLTEHAH